MRKSISRIFSVCVVGVVVMAGCSGVPYSRADKIAFGVLVGTATADWYTTDRAINRGGVEVNPLLDDRPSGEQVALLKLGQIGLCYLFGEIWPEDRQKIFYTCSVINGVVAIHNDSQ